MEEQYKDFHSGFVGLVGPTNSGKSTLMNALVGEKVSIVSQRSQTTYHGVKGIRNTPRAQVVFIDTPGFQRHPEHVARLLNRVAEKNAKEADILVWVFDASNPRVVNQINKLKDRITNARPKEKSFLVLNKVDKVKKPELLPLIQQIFALGYFQEIIPVSALKQDNVDRILSVLEEKLPQGIPYFPHDMITDRSQQFLVSEFIREKIYHATRQEIPYAVWVEIEAWEESEEGKVPTIRAVLHVDSDSKKGMIIGKGGEMLKRIGTEARAEAERLLGKQVCLKLHVDVAKEWKRDSRHLNRYLELN